MFSAHRLRLCAVAAVVSHGSLGYANRFEATTMSRRRAAGAESLSDHPLALTNPLLDFHQQPKAPTISANDLPDMRLGKPAFACPLGFGHSRVREGQPPSSMESSIA